MTMSWDQSQRGTISLDRSIHCTAALCCHYIGRPFLAQLGHNLLHHPSQWDRITWVFLDQMGTIVMRLHARHEQMELLCICSAGGAAVHRLADRDVRGGIDKIGQTFLMGGYQ